MMPVPALIERCIHRDPVAWCEFWSLVQEAASFTIRTLLRQNERQLSEVDDLLQELYLHLQELEFARLRAFRGTTPGELRSFVRVLAGRFMNHELRASHTCARHEVKLLRSLSPPDRNGPTEEQIAFARAELERLMTQTERKRLNAVCGEAAPVCASNVKHTPQPEQIGSRTCRRWRCHLYRKYGDKV
jgi:hypothetical protein